MGKLLEIVKNPSVVGGYINGVVNAITNRKNIYYLTFHRKIDGGWYNVEQKAELRLTRLIKRILTIL